ncbi:MAG: SufE family protein [Anaerolineaceae bacterium]
MKTINEIEDQLSADFNLLETWEEKYDYLIELGQDLPEMDEALKTDANLVKGCQSSVWFAINCKDERLYFEADSDSLIVKGLVSILHQMLSGQSARDYQDLDLTFFDNLGFWRHLSSQRSNGLTSMIGQLKQAAEACAGSPKDQNSTEILPDIV